MSSLLLKEASSEQERKRFPDARSASVHRVRQVPQLREQVLQEPHLLERREHRAETGATRHLTCVRSEPAGSPVGRRRWLGRVFRALRAALSPPS